MSTPSNPSDGPEQDQRADLSIFPTAPVCPLPPFKRDVADDGDDEAGDLCLASAVNTEVTTWDTSVPPQTSSTADDLSSSSYYTTVEPFTGSTIPSPTDWVTTVTSASAYSSSWITITLLESSSYDLSSPGSAMMSATASATATSTVSSSRSMTTPSWTLVVSTATPATTAMEQ